MTIYVSSNAELHVQPMIFDEAINQAMSAPGADTRT